jgi:hypothetical protein
MGAKINRRHFPVDQLDHGSDTEPSVSGEEFPAVSEPALLQSNTAGSLASFSSEVSRLGHLTGDGKDGESSWHASSLRIRDRRKRNVPWQ